MTKTTPTKSNYCRARRHLDFFALLPQQPLPAPDSAAFAQGATPTQQGKPCPWAPKKERDGVSKKKTKKRVFSLSPIPSRLDKKPDDKRDPDGSDNSALSMMEIMNRIS